MGASPMDNPKRYFEASSINYATFANNHIGVLLSVGTEDDLVDRRAHTDAFLLRSSRRTFSSAPASCRARRITGSAIRSTSREAIPASWRRASSRFLKERAVTGGEAARRAGRESAIWRWAAQSGHSTLDWRHPNLDGCDLERGTFPLVVPGLRLLARAGVALLRMHHLKEDVRTMSVETPAAASRFADCGNRIVNSLILTIRIDASAAAALAISPRPPCS